MDSERYEIGLKVRAEVLGDEYVNKAVQGATDFNREFQNLVTEYCWGEIWGQPPSRPQAAQHPESRDARGARPQP